MIKAAVHMATMSIDMMEITLMKFLFLFEKKYFRAMKKDRFKNYSFSPSLSSGGIFKLSINLSIFCAFSSTSST